MIHDDFFNYHGIVSKDVPVFYLNDIMENAADPAFDETAKNFLEHGFLQPPYTEFYIFIDLNEAFLVYGMKEGKFIQEFACSKKGKFVSPKFNRSAEFHATRFEGDKEISVLFSACLLIIFMKAMRRENISVSEKLNAARRKAGKYEYIGYTVIKNPIINSEKGESASTGVKQRPHWKRGHVRRYKSGRVTYVEPYVVNMDVGEITKKKTYIVR